MPIPEKSLREMMAAALRIWLRDTNSADLDDLSAEAADAAMSAIREYDPCFAKAAEGSMRRDYIIFMSGALTGICLVHVLLWLWWLW